LTFDLLASKLVSESRLTWAISAPILVFLCLSSRVRPDVRDRQTSDRQTYVRQKHRSMPLPYGGGGIIMYVCPDSGELYENYVYVYLVCSDAYCQLAMTNSWTIDLMKFLMTPLHSLTPKMWKLIYYMPYLLRHGASYYEFQHQRRPSWIFSCRKFCPREAEFGDS